MLYWGSETIMNSINAWFNGAEWAFVNDLWLGPRIIHWFCHGSRTSTFFPISPRVFKVPSHSGYLQIHGCHHSVMKTWGWPLIGTPTVATYPRRTLATATDVICTQLRSLCQKKTGYLGGTDKRPEAGRLTYYLQVRNPVKVRNIYPVPNSWHELGSWWQPSDWKSLNRPTADVGLNELVALFWLVVHS